MKIELVTTASFAAQAVLAYIGPGSGLSAIGTFLALVLGILVALFGFVWYPLKRLFRGKRGEIVDADQDPFDHDRVADTLADSADSRIVKDTQG